MLTRPLTTTLGAVALSALAACATSRYPDRYAEAPAIEPVYGQPTPVYGQPSYARPVNYAEYGVVRSVEIVPISSHPSGAGAILGAIAGGVVGNQFGSGTGRALTTVGGAVGGAVAGNAIEQRTRRDDEIFRVSVRFDDGSVRDFDYQRIYDLRVGDRVRFVEGQLEMVR